jgi:hypothetical protein
VSVSGTGTLLLKVVRAFPGSMAWDTSTTSAAGAQRLVLEHWLEAFSLPLSPYALEPITILTADLASSVPRDQQGVVQEYSPVVHRLRLSA